MQALPDPDPPSSSSASVTAVEGVLTRNASRSYMMMEQRPVDTSDPFTGSGRPASIASASSSAAALWHDDLAQSFSQLAASLRAAPAASASAFEELAARVAVLENARVQSAPDVLHTRLEAVEATQKQILETLERLQTTLDEVQAAATGPRKSDEDLIKLLDEFKLEQMRLPPRLFNATVFKSGAAIKPVAIGTNGKTPINFPSTKGEFEHITRERYAELLKAYGLSTAGEKEERRERLRSFLGMTPA
ncbi:hypothetical protein EXIGLDRAFT_837247 [Exidia glandulosa HHB12029]|uniref:SAP domain-containing protein n=1 Tax=Exidia glandulosa HHB12029 TaxID=1314781 RepID=A0A165H0U8_EXIGL|nr:hypothetical protein EXIGLDRAFT_838484 [Exidia glandulosa HHB12029]KZV91285.1 hypothetical protein EXIGLDRAFT_837247 [Exidia glandulosa HHB12029]